MQALCTSCPTRGQPAETRAVPIPHLPHLPHKALRLPPPTSGPCKAPPATALQPPAVPSPRFPAFKTLMTPALITLKVMQAQPCCTRWYCPRRGRSTTCDCQGPPACQQVTLGIERRQGRAGGEGVPTSQGHSPAKSKACEKAHVYAVCCTTSPHRCWTPLNASAKRIRCPILSFIYPGRIGPGWSIPPPLHIRLDTLRVSLLPL